MKNGLYVDIFGTHTWYCNGKIHCDDGPAVKFVNGDLIWYKDGSIHRYNDEPAMITNDGELSWYKDGKLHRNNGPAYILPSERKEWYQHGRLNRIDGPAVEWNDDTPQWYINGRELSKKEIKIVRLNDRLEKSLTEINIGNTTKRLKL